MLHLEVPIFVKCLAFDLMVVNCQNMLSCFISVVYDLYGACWYHCVEKFMNYM